MGITTDPRHHFAHVRRSLGAAGDDDISTCIQAALIPSTTEGKINEQAIQGPLLVQNAPLSASRRRIGSHIADS